MAPLKVLFITGFGRSGTTLLDNVLGQLEGFFSLGETQFIWDRSLLDNRLCGCGEAFRDCEVWGPVYEETLASLDDSEVREMIRQRDRLGSWRLLARSLRGPGADSETLSAYVRHTRDVLASVQRRTGSRVLVDSSKSPSHGHVLDRMPDVDLKVVHMVRNPRAVAFSWQKRKVYDDSGDETMYMARLSLRRSGLTWLSWNLVSEILWRKHRESYMLLRYEDFVERPRQTVRRILDLLGEDVPRLPFLDERTVELGPNHSVAGNPNRFVQGAVAIRRDDEWKSRMPTASQLQVAGWTWPLLARYGYFSPLVSRG